MLLRKFNRSSLANYCICGSLHVFYFPKIESAYRHSTMLVRVLSALRIKNMRHQAASKLHVCYYYFWKSGERQQHLLFFYCTVSQHENQPYSKRLYASSIVLCSLQKYSQRIAQFFISSRQLTKTTYVSYQMTTPLSNQRAQSVSFAEF